MVSSSKFPLNKCSVIFFSKITTWHLDALELLFPMIHSPAFLVNIGHNYCDDNLMKECIPF